MDNEPMSMSSMILVVILGGLIIRYLFFSPGDSPQPRDAASASRARELVVERIQQMFPQVDRRTILWDLQRNGGNITATTERILAGRMETPPVTFQPAPPPPSSTPPAAQSQMAKSPPKPAEPDLIQRYKLQNKVTDSAAEEEAVAKSKGWSSNRDERQASLQKRRDDMILAARKKMEAKLAAEKAAASST